MKNKKGINKTVWCGTVVKPLEFNHELVNENTGELIDKFYRFSLKTEVSTNKGRKLDSSVLPIIVSEKYLKRLDKEIELGDKLFIRGSWRVYSVSKNNSKRKVEQFGFVKHIEHVKEEAKKSINRFEFEGYLVTKLEEIQRDENKKLLKDEQGNFVPVLDEEGNKKYGVRLNKEKKIVNDYTVAINRTNHSDYVPCLSYFKLAKDIAENVELGSKVKGSGYVRSRSYKVHEGTDYEEENTVYEAVVVSLEVLPKENDNVVE